MRPLSVPLMSVLPWGITGTEVAREAADTMLLDDRFESIVAAVEEGRATSSPACWCCSVYIPPG